MKKKIRFLTTLAPSSSFCIQGPRNQYSSIKSEVLFWLPLNFLIAMSSSPCLRPIHHLAANGKPSLNPFSGLPQNGRRKPLPLVGRRAWAPFAESNGAAGAAKFKAIVGDRAATVLQRVCHNIRRLLVGFLHSSRRCITEDWRWQSKDLH